MLSTSSAALLTLGIVILLIMPGPTNTLFATAGLQRGVRRSAHLIGAEFAGYFVSITVLGCFLSHAATSLTWIPALLRIASSLYLAVLAVRMWQTASEFPASTQKAIGLRTLFVATLLNPKAILFAGTIFPAIAFERLPAYLEAMGIFTAALIPTGLAWIAFGAALGSGRLMRISPVHLQRCASIILAAFSLSLAWTVLRQVGQFRV
ncbi:LysE family translocator [Paraburkholderia phenazinium]|jgi:threonine/homoserine/homoserine lactone efflux protein|uniref:Threonine/homoserine/homoserine lactone efflux protein n=1 Tax=Paraburkholderia phenazinium TaxID=60549 RepID=A0A1N6JQK1_9BURK|nr:LysE family transporter [Paraburkholderia phenazinium]SIO46459.1 Threonine/homoserine/homoserine lactone efflux protein [Paraburkholderia phenazinium]